MSTPASSSLVWLITGTSSGFGRHLALALLARGEKVIATARASSLARLQDLRDAGADTLELDVTSPLETLKDIADKAVAIHGRIDVVVNNAGYIAFGALEENTPEETYNQFNTNVFGPLNVSRAVLPHMRARKSGTIIFIGSIGGWRGGASFGLYIGTKHAIRGLAESLSMEVTPLGLRVLNIEPGYFRTEFLTPNHRAPMTGRISDYNAITSQGDAGLSGYNGKQPGDPEKFVKVMIDLVKSEGAAEGREVPVSLPLGSDALKVIGETCESTVKVLTGWKDVITSTDFPAGQ